MSKLLTESSITDPDDTAAFDKCIPTGGELGIHIGKAWKKVNNEHQIILECTRLSQKKKKYKKLFWSGLYKTKLCLIHSLLGF
jgi:hypothetical protein